MRTEKAPNKTIIPADYNEVNRTMYVMDSIAQKLGMSEHDASKMLMWKEMSMEELLKISGNLQVAIAREATRLQYAANNNKQV